MVCATRRAFVEGHDHICSKRALNIHNVLGSKGVLGSINVTLELYSILVQIPDFGQGKYLVASRIAQNWTIPSHEIVKPSQTTNQFMPRAQVEMVCIGEYHFRSECTDLLHYEAFHRAERANRHERWCLYLSVGCTKIPLSGSTLTVFYLEVEHGEQNLTTASPNAV
jgi:hypothetical protein